MPATHFCVSWPESVFQMPSFHRTPASAFQLTPKNLQQSVIPGCLAIPRSVCPICTSQPPHVHARLPTTPPAGTRSSAELQPGYPELAHRSVGFAELSAMPLATESPIRKLVNEPGPNATPMASRSMGFNPQRSSSSRSAGATSTVW